MCTGMYVTTKEGSGGCDLGREGKFFPWNKSLSVDTNRGTNRTGSDNWKYHLSNSEWLIHFWNGVSRDLKQQKWRFFWSWLRPPSPASAKLFRSNSANTCQYGTSIIINTMRNRGFCSHRDVVFHVIVKLPVPHQRWLQTVPELCVQPTLSVDCRWRWGNYHSHLTLPYAPS